MGDIITIGNKDTSYKYELPPMPPERDIWYCGAPKKMQYWRTPHDPDFKWLDKKGELRNVKQMGESERIKYINYIRDLWENGLWFMNNGEPTYITGAHFEHLLVNRFSGQLLFYLDSQRERFYFRELTNKTRSCDGRVWVKPRRAGLTTEQITEAIRVVLSGFGNKVGMQSTTMEICNRTLMKPIIDSYVNRPPWMREVFYTSNGRKPIKELQLTSSVFGSDKTQPLGGLIKSFPTVASALDGDGWMLIIGDEKSKWETCSPREALEINLKAIVNPNKRGKIDALSTVGDSRDAQKAVVDWHKLIADSNPKILNANGKTNSGLWLYFVDATDSLLLLEELPGVLDKYGKIDKGMATEWIMNDISKHPKDSKEYIYAKYKMPLELRDALLTPTGNGTFNKIKITARLDILRSLPNDRKPYVRGRFEYDQSGNVYFVADEYGKWLVAIHPYFSKEKNIDTRNRFSVNNGVFMPPVNPEFGIGYDPIRYRKEDTSSNSLSQASIIVAQKHDYFGSGNANRYAALYLDRPDDPSDANKECIKACKYYGAPCMHERVIETVKTDFTDERCLPFLMKSKKDQLYGIWIDAQGKIVKNALDWMKTRFATPKSEDEVCQYEIMPFEACLTDMDGFDLAHTTKFDVMMAMIELEHCLEQLNFTNMTDKSDLDKMKFIQSIFPKRKN